MSENPFKIIRATDEPPASLRGEVVSSVKFVLLLMRFLQLFMADFSAAIFDKVRRTSADNPRPQPLHNMDLELLKSSLAKAFEQYVVGIINGLPGAIRPRPAAGLVDREGLAGGREDHCGQVRP
ncbi:MAG: hypothetical protein IPH53_03985 [Flavobacteriales bacterium]|nr:hypothetical protein [Flavobacteriales bacterium]